MLLCHEITNELSFNLRYCSTFYDIGVYENLYPKNIVNDPVQCAISNVPRYIKLFCIFTS